MRTLVLSTVTTLDGFIAGPDGELDWIPADDELHRHFTREFESADAVLFDRGSYEILVPFWDDYDLGDDASPEAVSEFARVFRTKSRVVFSNTLDSVDEKATLIREDIVAEVARLKNQTGAYLLLDCGPELLATCVEHDLIDEYRLVVIPVALGRGKPLFSELRDRLNLNLLSTTSFASGAVLHRYQPTRIPPPER